MASPRLKHWSPWGHLPEEHLSCGSAGIQQKLQPSSTGCSLVTELPNSGFVIAQVGIKHDPGSPQANVEKTAVWWTGSMNCSETFGSWELELMLYHSAV